MSASTGSPIIDVLPRRLQKAKAPHATMTAATPKVPPTPTWRYSVLGSLTVAVDGTAACVVALGVGPLVNGVGGFGAISEAAACPLLYAP